MRGPLRRLQQGWAAAAVGGWAFMIALSVYAYEEGGAAAVGLAALARMLPAGIAAPFAGVLADRYPRRDVLVATCAGRGAVLLLVAAAVAADAPFAAVLGLAAAFTVLQTAHRPAQAAILPQLASTPTQLATANTVITALNDAAFVAGALVGGVLVAATSVEAALAATAGAFLLGALPLAALPRDAVPLYRRDGGGVLRELAGGVHAIRADRDVRLLFGVLSVSTLLEGAIDVLVVVTALTLVDLGDGGVGWLNAAWGVGGLAGGVVAMGLLRRGRLAAGLAFGGVLAGLPLVGTALVPKPVVAFAMLGVLGVGYALVETAGATLLQRLPSDEVLARITGVVESGYWLTTGIGAALAPILLDAIGTRATLTVIGLGLPLVVAARWLSLARLEAGRPVPERPFALLRALDLFAAVPLGTVETLAARVTEHRVQAGRVIVREGDPGYCFFVVGEGSVDVVCDGQPLATLGAGQAFGETALLRACARTATVTAREPSTFYALDRDMFIETVTGHRRSAEAADAAIAGYGTAAPLARTA